ncbi:MAG: tetratricopeptide repeat protein [Rhodocyclaceae bacterium]|nr:tetratricopeptide repeat protein [Rhodocyclaceae bacterium]
MSYRANFTGVLSIDPPLSRIHCRYLEAFSQTRRVCRDAAFSSSRPDEMRTAAGLPIGEEGGFFVGAGGMLGQEGGGPMLDPGGPAPADVGISDFNRPPAGQPHLWCCWQPTADGGGLHIPETGSHYEPISWFTYLQQHFLLPWGYRLSGDIDYRGADSVDVGRLSVRDHTLHYAPAFGRGPLSEGWAIREQGEARLAAKDWKGAVSAFSQLITRAPDWPDSWWLLGSAQARAGQLGECVVSLDQSIARETDAARREARRAKLHGLMRQAGKAADALERARVLRAQSSFDAATMEYQAFFDALPTDQRAGDEAVSAIIGIGLCEQGAGCHDKALAAYFRAAQTCPENPSGWTYMAYLQAYQLGTPREAIESFRLAIAAGNDGSPIYNELGMACGRCGLHDDARDAFIEGTNADPDDPLPWLNLGHSFMALGDADEAAGCFEHAAEFHDPRCHAAALEGLAAARDALAKG